MSYRILKNAGYIPPELAERKEIDSLLDMLESAEDEQLKIRQMRRLEVMMRGPEPDAGVPLFWNRPTPTMKKSSAALPS